MSFECLLPRHRLPSTIFDHHELQARHHSCRICCLHRGVGQSRPCSCSCSEPRPCASSEPRRPARASDFLRKGRLALQLCPMSVHSLMEVLLLSDLDALECFRWLLRWLQLPCRRRWRLRLLVLLIDAHPTVVEGRSVVLFSLRTGSYFRPGALGDCIAGLKS